MKSLKSPLKNTGLILGNEFLPQKIFRPPLKSFIKNHEMFMQNYWKIATILIMKKIKIVFITICKLSFRICIVSIGSNVDIYNIIKITI
jgi:hypothetical protein